VSHGDEFDSIMHSGGWLIWLGDVSHGFLLKINTLVKPERQEDTGCLAAFIGVSMEAVLFERIGSSVLGQAPSGECRFLLDDD
jgi:hypothetical protein